MKINYNSPRTEPTQHEEDVLKEGLWPGTAAEAGTKPLWLAQAGQPFLITWDCVTHDQIRYWLQTVWSWCIHGIHSSSQPYAPASPRSNRHWESWRVSNFPGDGYTTYTYILYTYIYIYTHAHLFTYVSLWWLRLQDTTLRSGRAPHKRKRHAMNADRYVSVLKSKTSISLDWRGHKCSRMRLVLWAPLVIGSHYPQALKLELKAVWPSRSFFWLHTLSDLAVPFVTCYFTRPTFLGNGSLAGAGRVRGPWRQCRRLISGALAHSVPVTTAASPWTGTRGLSANTGLSQLEEKELIPQIREISWLPSLRAAHVWGTNSLRVLMWTRTDMLQKDLSNGQKTLP